jgi:hypothetical protein
MLLIAREFEASPPARTDRVRRKWIKALKGKPGKRIRSVTFAHWLTNSPQARARDVPGEEWVVDKAREFGSAYFAAKVSQ